ncbi:Poly(ADPribose) polymerase and DNA-Ligase Zn-finger region domain containing protein [Acanthamoeba castellanii str. Neff]|uniref:Poly(ADPribose) polymerase and DNA-Ligase Zn-finger region domain containing protein n=1 Tax=Acanthamoeba castellanii (strain ATCC 30010 / Neff) TaxID=1257118 RepID=L8GU65_ACACF|nr:Poly(ADPribose) polymerase and DNA-Ligase Zn-finger region domain containing protein [Acanthamoeba castellanii str. Neff]ELR16153.1 Poly(ADPribose) polymerase and DNA-Ligase Zn-finger region domain containing protein [Acanthamoeba castellanii str. Neff]
MDASRVAFGTPSWGTAQPVLQLPSAATVPSRGGGGDFPCCVEYAKSARSQCKACSRQIPNGAVRIGQQYDRDHSGYLWYHVDCFPNFPRDGSTTAESFLFGFEKLAPKAQALVQNAFEGRTAPAKRGAISDDDDDDEYDNSPQESEGDSEEEVDEEEQETSRPALQVPHQPHQLQQQFLQQQILQQQLVQQQQLLQQQHLQQQLLQQQQFQQAKFSSPTPWYLQQAAAQPSTKTTTEAVAGLAEAVSAAGLARGFFGQPPQEAHRALRAAVEAFEISADVDELADTLTLIHRHFAL